MSFSTTPFSGSAFSDLGATSVSVAVTLPTNIATLSLGTVTVQGNVDIDVTGFQLTSSLGTISTTGTANVSVSSLGILNLSLGTVELSVSEVIDAPSFLATLSVGTLTFTGDANITLTNEVAHYGTDVYGNANAVFSEASYTEELITSIGTVTIQGAANITVSGFALTLSNNLNAVTTVGNANVTPSSNLLNLSLGTLSIEGTGNLTLPSLQLTTSFNQPSVVGTANISINGFALQISSPLSDIIVTTINQNDYAKDRTVHVSSRKHNIKSLNVVANEN